MHLNGQSGAYYKFHKIGAPFSIQVQHTPFPLCPTLPPFPLRFLAWFFIRCYPWSLFPWALSCSYNIIILKRPAKRFHCKEWAGKRLHAISKRLRSYMKDSTCCTTTLQIKMIRLQMIVWMHRPTSRSHWAKVPTSPN